MSRDQKLKMKEIGEFTLFEQTNWYFWKRRKIPNFLRLEWMQLRFKIKVLKNSRLNLGVLNDVFPHDFSLKCNGRSFQMWSVRNI